MSMEMGFLCRRTFEQRVVACTTNVRRAHQDEARSCRIEAQNLYDRETEVFFLPSIDKLTA